MWTPCDWLRLPEALESKVSVVFDELSIVWSWQVGMLPISQMPWPFRDLGRCKMDTWGVAFFCSDTLYCILFRDLVYCIYVMFREL